MRPLILRLFISLTLLLIHGNAYCEYEMGSKEYKSAEELENSFQMATIYSSAFGLGLGRKELTGEFLLKGYIYLAADIIGYGLLVADLNSDDGIRIEDGDGTWTVLGLFFSAPSVFILLFSRISQLYDNYEIYSKIKEQKISYYVLPQKIGRSVKPAFYLTYNF